MLDARQPFRRHVAAVSTRGSGLRRGLAPCGDRWQARSATNCNCSATNCDGLLMLIFYIHYTPPPPTLAYSIVHCSLSSSACLLSMLGLVPPAVWRLYLPRVDELTCERWITHCDPEERVHLITGSARAHWHASCLGRIHNRRLHCMHACMPQRERERCTQQPTHGSDQRISYYNLIRSQHQNHPVWTASFLIRTATSASLQSTQIQLKKSAPWHSHSGCCAAIISTASLRQAVVPAPSVRTCTHKE
jgi:hypothetical protein